MSPFPSHSSRATQIHHLLYRLATHEPQCRLPPYHATSVMTHSKSTVFPSNWWGEGLDNPIQTRALTSPIYAVIASMVESVGYAYEPSPIASSGPYKRTVPSVSPNLQGPAFGVHLLVSQKSWPSEGVGSQLR